MRKLKDGTVKYKKSAFEAAAWMNQKPNPLPTFIKGQAVEVYRTASWTKASVVSSSPNGCTVRLAQGGQNVNIYDARCIRPIQNGND